MPERCECCSGFRSQCHLYAFLLIIVLLYPHKTFCLHGVILLPYFECIFIYLSSVYVRDSTKAELELGISD